jgi:LysR family transcriptional regulator for bpeEF and oprC
MKLRTLKVQAPCSLTRRLIAEALPRFLHAHPGLRVLLCDTSDTEEMLAHDADVAIRIGQLTGVALLTNQIGVIRWVTCASPEFIECNGVPESPAHVDPLHCIAVLEPHSDRAQQWLFRRGAETHTILPNGPLAFSDCDSAVSAAVHGGGYVRVIGFEAAQQVAAGLLRPVLDDWNDAMEPIAVFQRYPAASEDVLAFRTFMTSIFPSWMPHRTTAGASCLELSLQPCCRRQHDRTTE